MAQLARDDTGGGRSVCVSVDTSAVGKGWSISSGFSYLLLIAAMPATVQIILTRMSSDLSVWHLSRFGEQAWES